jgi:hypothetical protein
VVDATKMRGTIALLLAVASLLHATAALPPLSRACATCAAARFPAFVAPGRASARMLARMGHLQQMRAAEAQLRPNSALSAMKQSYKVVTYVFVFVQLCAMC